MSRHHSSPASGIAHLETLERRRLLSFGGATNYSVGTNPQSIVAAHFNNDGHLDLATADAGTDKVTVRLGNGAGGFGAAQPISAGAFPRSLAAADFNKDGKVDLVTTSASWNISLQLGNGDGTFQAPVEGRSYGEPLSVAAGDLNGDGYADLVVTGDDWNSFGFMDVHLGNASGLTRGETYSLGGPPGGVTLADVTDDGMLDAITTEGVIFRGRGTGTFDDYNGGGMLAWAVTVADLRGERSADMIFVNETIEVISGGGRFSHTANGSLHKAVATADFNGDGKLDVVTADTDTNTVSILLGNGDGSLSYAGAFATGTSPVGIAVGDFNGDGRPDVAVANAGSGTVSVLLNNESGTLPPPPPPSVRIGDATVTEGNAAAVNATFTLSLSRAADVDVTVQYATANLTAAAGSDYTAKSAAVTIPAGQTSATFTVAVTGDRLAEPTETFAVNLSAPTNATIADGQGVGTILDNEPRISINNVSGFERNSGTSTFTFTIKLSAAYDQAVTVNYATTNGTATAGTDYTAKSGVVTFAAGETIKTITVTVKGEKLRESNETFYVDLFGASSNALIAAARGTGTIYNDDNRL